MKLISHCLTAVSYTHLDVYKRQVCKLPLCAWPVLPLSKGISCGVRFSPSCAWLPFSSTWFTICPTGWSAETPSLVTKAFGSFCSTSRYTSPLATPPYNFFFLNLTPQWEFCSRCGVPYSDLYYLSFYNKLYFGKRNSNTVAFPLLSMIIHKKYLTSRKKRSTITIQSTDI